MTRRRMLLAGVLLLWMLALVLVAKLSLDRLSVPPWGNPVADSLSAEIAGETHVGQQFTAPLPGLYAIKVGLDPATVSGAREVTFHLKTDPSAAADLWTTTFSSGDVQPGAPLRFQFERLGDSKARTYYFYFESAASSPGDALAVRYGSQTTLGGASAHLDGQPVAGNLQFHTIYALRTREKLDLLLARMAEGRPHLLGTKGFYVGLAVVYALVLGAFLWLVAKTVLDEQAGGA